MFSFDSHLPRLIYWNLTTQCLAVTGGGGQVQQIKPAELAFERTIIYTVNRKNTKMFLPYLPQNHVDSDKIW